MNITGKNGDLAGLTTDGQTYKNAQTYGFHLAGVDIPHPTKHTVHKSGTTTKYQAELPSTCGLHWVKRTTADAKSVYVLAMDNCSASGGSITPIGPDNSGNGESECVAGAPCTRSGAEGEFYWVKHANGTCCCEFKCEDKYTPSGELIYKCKKYCVADDGPLVKF